MLNALKEGGVALDGNATGRAVAEIKRWSAGRKQQVVLRLLRGEWVDALSRELARLRLFDTGTGQFVAIFAPDGAVSLG